MNRERLAHLGRRVRPLLLAAGLALLPALAATALAAPEIADVRVSQDAEGSDAARRYVAPVGTERLYVLFDYLGAADDTIAIHVVGSGLTLFEAEDSYDGEGTASVEITGAQMYKSLAETAEVDNEAMRSDIEAATNQANPSIQRVNNAMDTVAKMSRELESIAYYFELLDPDAALEGALSEIDFGVAELDEYYGDVREVPADDTAQRAALLGDMLPTIDSLDGAIQTLVDLSDGLSAAPLPETGPDAEIDVTIRVSTGLSSSTTAGSGSFLISDDGSDLPEDPDDDANELPGGATRTPRGSGITERTPVPGVKPASASGADADEDEDAGDDDAEGAASDDATASDADAAASSANTLTSPGDAAEAAGADAADAVAMADTEEQDAPSSDDAEAARDAAARSSQGGEAGAAEPAATWTVQAVSAADVPAEPGGTSSEAPLVDQGTGPNLAILGFGVLALIGLAIWYRRRS